MKLIFRKFIPIIIIISIIQDVENKTMDQKTFNDLQEKIDNLIDLQLDLDSDYIFDPKTDKTSGIIIKNPLRINGKNHTING